MVTDNYKLGVLIGSQEWHLDRLYAEYARELGFLFKNHSGRMSDYKKKQLEAVMLRFHNDLTLNIANQSLNAVDLSNENTNLFTANYVKGLNLKPATLESILSLNVDAATAFKQRAIDGLKLSERVWNLTGETQTSLNQVLGSGVMNGRSAADMAKDLKSYLKEPDRNYRRVRNADGKLVLSNPGKDYKPGQGVYRSSYKNALRLSRNEVNLAYRNNEHERRKALPFVMGQKIHLSNSHPEYDICDELVGDYPKDFRFTGWHVNCLCFTTSIKVPRAKFKAYLGGAKLDTSGLVTSMPKTAFNYLNDNAPTFRGWSNPPYFLADNFKFKDGAYVPKFGGQIPPTVISKPATPKATPKVAPKATTIARVLKPKAPPIKAPVLSGPKPYVPVNSPAEAEARIRAAGVKNVVIDKTSRENLNAMVQAFEEEAAFSPLELNYFAIGKRGKIQAGADAIYNDMRGGENKILINNSFLNRKHVQEPDFSYKAKLERLKNLVTKYETQYLGVPGYNQTDVRRGIRNVNIKINELAYREKQGFTARPWTVSSSAPTKAESIKNTIVHEIGHQRHYRQLQLTSDFDYLKINSFSEYGETNFKEFFVEWYTYWRSTGDETRVPTSLMQLFNKLPRTKK